MEEAVAFIERNARRPDSFALAGQMFEPETVFGAEIVLHLAAEPLCKSGAGAAGGDGDLEFAATNDGRVIEIAEFGDVHDVAENAVAPGVTEDAAMERFGISGRDDQECSDEIVRLIGAL